MQSGRNKIIEKEYGSEIFFNKLRAIALIKDFFSHSQRDCNLLEKGGNVLDYIINTFQSMDDTTDELIKAMVTPPRGITKTDRFRTYHDKVNSLTLFYANMR